MICIKSKSIVLLVKIDYNLFVLKKGDVVDWESMCRCTHDNVQLRTQHTNMVFYLIPN